MSVFRSILLTAAMAAAAHPVEAQDVTLFRDVRVFDGERAIERTSVLVRDGRIAGIGLTVRAPAGATVIDGAGHTLLPGLIDAHTHVFGNALRDALIFGVTTELDMFTDATLARSLRAEQAANRADARADIFSAGTLVTAPRGHGTEYGIAIPTLTSADSADAFVAARIAEGSDYIKIVYDDGSGFNLPWPTLDEPTLRAAIAAAKQQHRLAVVHATRATAAATAIGAGASGLVHLFTDAPPAPDFAQRVQRSGAFVIPTLVVLRSITGTPGAGSLLEDERINPYLTNEARAGLRQAFPANPRHDYAHAVETVKRLKAAGVPILAGTDAPNPGTAHGAALHRELELLVEAGLSARDALAAATSTPAAAFGLNDRGRIRTGLRADLLLVRGDPTADIAATRDIVGVWKRGVPVDRERYRTTLAGTTVAATSPTATGGEISNFDDGKLAPAFGTTWNVTTDAMAGGGSKATLDVAREGSARWLKVTGTIDGAVPYAWAGAMWSPGSIPMQPGNLSAHKGVAFRVRADVGTLNVILFSEARGMTPLMHPIEVGAEWREVYVPWSTFGIDGSDVMAFMVTAGPTPGPFRFELDDVRLR